MEKKKITKETCCSFQAIENKEIYSKFI